MPNEILKREGKRRGRDIMTNNFPGSIKNINIFKAQYISGVINKNKSPSRHITIKLQKIKRQKNFKRSRRKKTDYFKRKQKLG